MTQKYLPFHRRVSVSSRSGCSYGFVAAHWPPWGYRANRVPLSHANSLATAVIASRRGLTSNTSWLVFHSIVGVSPLLLAPPSATFFHQSLVLQTWNHLFLTRLLFVFISPIRFYAQCSILILLSLPVEKR